MNARGTAAGHEERRQMNRLFVRALVLALAGLFPAAAIAQSAGTITGTEYVVGTNDRGNSYSASPVLHDGMLYVLTDRGMLTNFDARTGAKHYHQQRLPQPYQFKASPTAADGKLYLASEVGDVIVVKMGKTFEVLATNKMPDQTFIASPVVVGGDLYLRSQDTLYCIREMN